MSIWEKKSEIIRKKLVGRSMIYCERYVVDGGERRYYIEANGPDYRIWKRVVGGDELRALEIFASFRFWVWLIEACDSVWATRLITWWMHRTL